MALDVKLPIFRHAFFFPRDLAAHRSVETAVTLTAIGGIFSRASHDFASNRLAIKRGDAVTRQARTCPKVICRDVFRAAHPNQISLASFPGVGVNPSPYDKARLLVPGNPLALGDGIIDRETGSGGRVLVCVHDEHTAFQTLAPAALDRDPAVEREENLAARGRKAGPVARKHGIAQGRRTPLHIVGQDQL